MRTCYHCRHRLLSNDLVPVYTFIGPNGSRNRTVPQKFSDIVYSLPLTRVCSLRRGVFFSTARCVHARDESSDHYTRYVRRCCAFSELFASRTLVYGVITRLAQCVSALPFGAVGGGRRRVRANATPTFR